MSLREDIITVLHPPHNQFEIIKQFEEWAQNRHNELMAEAEHWLLQLYEIDHHFFASFLIRNIPHKKPQLIQAMLSHTEQNGEQDIFSAYYRHLPQEQINQEIQSWIDEKLKADEIVRRFRMRFASQKALPMSEETYIALYNYAPQIWERDLLDVFKPSYGMHSVTQRFVKGSNYSKFRAFVKESMNKKKSADAEKLYHALLRRFGTESEIREEVNRIIKANPSWEKAQTLLHQFTSHLSEKEFKEIQNRYGQGNSKTKSALFSFMFNFSNSFGKHHIETEFAHAKTEAQVEALVTHLRQSNHWRFYQLAEYWILPVYQIAPDLCLSLVTGYQGEQIKLSTTTALELLKKVQQRGHRQMLRFVFAQVYNQEAWNAALLDLANAEMPLRERTMALEDLDCQPRYVYGNQKRAYLTDEVAAALYRSHSGFLYSFIFNNLAPNTAYPALLAATEGTDDFYPVFRQVADGKIWKAQMQALLARDIPAEQIESELERYQLNRRSTHGAWRNTKDMDATVLKGFIDKYGEAVLPFFERYIRWATEGRIKSLLALEIDRAELLRELNTLARREPQAMSRISHVWAIPLYERGASFFESFLIRYIGRDNEYVTRELLKRAEANHQKTLFRALYQLVSRGAEWQNQISRFLDTNPSDESLMKFLDLYDIPNWDFALSESTATRLYQRNPDLFTPFIMKHLSRQSRWGMRMNYDNLIKAAEAKPEQHLALLKSLDYERYWKSQMEAMLKQDIPGEEAAQRLESLHPKDTWMVQGTSILHKVFDKFGLAVVPYLVKHLHWVKVTNEFMEKLEKIAPPALFWEAVFKTMYWHQSNSWSYQRWIKALDDLIEHPVSEMEAGMMLQLLSPPQLNQWHRHQVPEATILLLYKKYPNAARAFIEQYYSPSIENPLFRLALNNQDEEILDYLSYRAMDSINHQLNQGLSSLRFGSPKKTSMFQETIHSMAETVINRLEALYQRDPALYVRHAAMIMSWWRPFAMWNPDTMQGHNPIYIHIASQHLSDWIENAEGIRELLESPNIFVQILGLNILRDAQHELAAQRILENKRIFRQLLLGRARRSTKRLALSGIEQAIAQNPAFASELLPILEEAADFYGRLALSEQMMISITRIKHAIEQGLPVPVSYPVEGKSVGA